MERPETPRFRRHHQIAIVLLIAVVAAYAFWARGDRAVPTAQNTPGAALSPEAAAPGPPAGPTAPAGPATTATATVAPPAAEASSPAATESTAPYDVAHARVQEDRGQAMGLAARVTVPPELQHYSDRRRFLAVQMADSREEQYEVPKDDADLAAMLREGKLVEMAALTEDYILYDIGLDAADDPANHLAPFMQHRSEAFTGEIEVRRVAVIAPIREHAVGVVLVVGDRLAEIGEVERTLSCASERQAANSKGKAENPGSHQAGIAHVAAENQ